MNQSGLKKKKKKSALGLGLNLIMMQFKELKFRPILREINLNGVLWGLMQNTKCVHSNWAISSQSSPNKLKEILLKIQHFLIF